MIISFFIFRHSVKASVLIIETVSSSLLYPILRLQQAIIIPLVGWFEKRTTINTLQDHLEQLHKINEELYAENIALKSVCSYANDIKELQDFNQRYELIHGRIVQVLARHFSSTNQFFLVNAGASQGIKKDMVALYCNNIVGKVIEVYPWYCKICLVTDSDCKVAVTCQESYAVGKKYKKGAHGIHEGVNDVLRTTVRYVSHLEKVRVNDTIISSGEGLVFPKGFALGKVIESKKGELFYDITIKPILDLPSLEYCILIAKEDIER